MVQETNIYISEEVSDGLRFSQGFCIQLLKNHRMADLGRDQRVHLVQSLAQAGTLRSGCPRPRPSLSEEQ